MNWNALAREYTEEAEALQKHITKLKCALKRASCSEQNELHRRIALLYTMYLECRHTGQLLAEHPAALRENEEAKAHGEIAEL